MSGKLVETANTDHLRQHLTTATRYPLNSPNSYAKNEKCPPHLPPLPVSLHLSFYQYNRDKSLLHNDLLYYVLAAHGVQRDKL